MVDGTQARAQYHTRRSNQELVRTAAFVKQVPNKRWNEENSAHMLSVSFLERIYHGNVLAFSHFLAKYETTFKI